MRSRLLLVLALFCPLLGGCMVGYAFPELAVTPPVQVPAPDEVHVFRVDVTDESCSRREGEDDRFVLRRLHVFPGGVVLPQARVSLHHGCFFVGPVNFSIDRSYPIELRLYRPGFRTIRARSWCLPPAIEWKAATTVPAQERAIDDLLATGTHPTRCRISERMEELLPDPGDEPLVCCGTVCAPSGLARGTFRPFHSSVLRFAAGEYERLAMQCPAWEGSQKDRLRAKAQALRERAGE